jgi:release factor glutamine methyltransferase
VTLGETVQVARVRLVAAGIPADEAGRDAELLARHALAWDRATYLARTREQADEAWGQHFAALVERRTRREPVAYIRGVQEFWGRDFIVSPAVLIPRPETELIVEEALSWASRRGAPLDRLVIADVGTGSGCLAVTLAAERTDAQVFATDISQPALEIASRNAARLGVADRVSFLHGRYLDPVPGSPHLIVANPPYVREVDAASLPPEVALYEPHEALFAGADGMRDVRGLLSAAATRLAARGALVVEIGLGQAEDVRRAVHDTPGLSLVALRPDLQNIPRVAVIHRV